ncbi:cupin domain-containing protein [Flavobacterium sp.]|uniref:cupin domain-containing protein n=1 Tax=Flavobacterium sp. TaxID=239 RepID=UPI0039E45FBF
MAFKGKQINNPKTGQHILFLQTAKDTNGQLLEMETTYNAKSKEPVAHYHPYQAEDFTVLSGELTVRIKGQLKTLHAGDTLHIPANQVHAMWNASTEKTIVNWKVQPAMDTEYLFEMMYGLAHDGKTNKNGMPNFFQLILTARKFSDVFRLAKPSFTIQEIYFFFLSPWAHLFGYRSTDKKYLD